MIGMMIDPDTSRANPSFATVSDGWVERLSADNAERDRAIEELREILIRGLRKSLQQTYEVSYSVEDIAQESLLKILSNLSQFHGKSRFTTWAMTIAIRTGVSSLRRKYHQDQSLEAFDGQDGYRIDLSGSFGEIPENQAEYREVLELLQRLIQESLSDRQREALRGALDGYSTDGLAERLRIPRNAVYKLLHDARMKLKEGFAKEGFTDHDVLRVLGKGHS